MCKDLYCEESRHRSTTAYSYTAVYTGITQVFLYERFRFFFNARGVLARGVLAAAGCCSYASPGCVLWGTVTGVVAGSAHG